MRINGHNQDHDKTKKDALTLRHSQLPSVHGHFAHSSMLDWKQQCKKGGWIFHDFSCHSCFFSLFFSSPSSHPSSLSLRCSTTFVVAMGIPIVLPSEPSTRTPNHSAKASWSASQGQTLADASTSSSSSSFSSLTPSHLHSRPPLSSLAYVPPPPSIWGSSSSSLSPSPTRITQSPTSFTSPSGRVEAQDSIPTNPTQQGDRNTLDARSLLSSLESMRSPPPRVRAHPNLRRISRVPVFITSSSLPTTLASSSSTGRASTSPRSGYEPPSNQDSSSPSSVPRQDQLLENNGTSPPTVPRPVWNPTSPSLVHYLTRPLPPPPSSSSLLSVQRAPEHSDEGFLGGHYINRNHPANRGRLYLDEVGRLTVDPRFRPSRQEEQEEDEGDSEQRRGFDRRSRSRPREGRRPTILTTDSTPRSSLSPTLSTLIPVNTTTSLSSAPPRTPLSSHPAIQYYQGSRTTIQADAFQQGLIHIYPEDHDPILMFGRPILSSTEHSSDYSSGRSQQSPTMTTTSLTGNHDMPPTSTSSRSSRSSNTTSALPTETPPSNH